MIDLFVSDEQLRQFRDANVCNGSWQFARIALGECCIPFSSGEIRGYRYPFDHERENARAYCVARIRMEAA